MKKKRKDDEGLSSTIEAAEPAPVLKLLAAHATPLAAMGRSKRYGSFYGIASGLIIALFGLGVYGLLNYQGSFGNVQVAGISITKNAPDSQLQNTVSQKLNSLTYSISYPDAEPQSYTAEKLGVTYNVAATVRAAKTKKETGPIWQRLQWWRSETIAPTFTVDEQKLADFIATEATHTVKAPVNATLAVVNAEVRTTTDTAGTAYQLPDAQQQLLAAVRQATSKQFTLTLDDLPASVPASDVATFKSRIESTLAQDIVFTIKGRAYRPSKITIGSWVEPVKLDNKKSILEFNSGRIESYLDTIAANYIDPPRSEIMMTKEDGSKVVLVSGQDGTDIKDKKALSTEIAQLLASAQPIRRDLIFEDSTYKTVNAQDYDKWLVADVTNKRMDAYEKSTLVKSFNISAGAPATPTVLGEYKIYAKVRKQDMRGLNADGSSYFQANVEWVNYFHGSYAIHGNYWRPPSWFGRINSSHGCVGIQDFDGEWIYNWAPVGTPVITHI